MAATNEARDVVITPAPAPCPWLSLSVLEEENARELERMLAHDQVPAGSVLDATETIQGSRSIASAARQRGRLRKL
jgi:hypothetical protein